MKRISALILTVFTVLTTMGQTPADSTKVLFQTGQRQFSPMLGDNRASMADFIDKVRKAAASDGIDSVVVNGYASPDGNSKGNLRLAKNRRKTIVNYITNKTGIDTTLIRPSQGDVAWDELRLMVEANPDVPSREKVLDILDNTPVVMLDANGRLKDSRKGRLMRLDGGKPYRWLLKHIFPQLRSVVASLFYTMPEASQEEVDSQAIVPPPVANEVEETGSVCVKVTDTALAEDTVAVAPFTTDPLHRFALKTNLLYDAALMPNLELEWRMNSQWSLAVEGALAWWKKDAKHKYYRIAMVSPEIRRWFNTRGPWHGMYAGLFAGVGKYDLENGGTGYMGNDCYMVGFSYGYMWPIGRTLSLEAGIGAGYMYTRYKEYNPFEGHYLYQRTKTLNYFGPLKLKFSLAWRFNDINKPHKNRQAQ